MNLFGIPWDLWIQPFLMWCARKWVRFVVRKKRIWGPGTPFPRYFRQVGDAVLHTPFTPWRLYRALLPLPLTRKGWNSMVSGPRR